MNAKKHVVVLTGAGISAESGIKTFRGNDGLWENHRIEDVATPEAWTADKQLVLNFYNQRRKQLLSCHPNEAHLALVQLEQKFKVTIITQNVDDLHERAGSTIVIHLHGELRKARSSANENLIYNWDKDITLDDKCDLGSQLRPHIVWFGEAVPLIDVAVDIIKHADSIVVVGTSLQVYPAAGLINYAPYECPKWLIDIDTQITPRIPNLILIHEKASTGLKKLASQLLQNA